MGVSEADYVAMQRLSVSLKHVFFRYNSRIPDFFTCLLQIKTAFSNLGVVHMTMFWSWDWRDSDERNLREMTLTGGRACPLFLPVLD